MGGLCGPTHRVACHVLASVTDVFVCLSLADAMQRSDLVVEAKDQLSRCEQDMQNVLDQAWDTSSLTLSQIRLAILHDDRKAANRLLDTLFERGFRNRPLVLNDPILRRMEQSEAYRRLLSGIAKAIAADWQKISSDAAAGRSTSFDQR